jgi:hypothetical protein
MPRVRLTAELEQRIIASIRLGAFPQIAAEAAGVPADTFADWLRRGRQKTSRRFRRFYEQVRQAQAQARLRAEMEARELDACFWLRHGPGKETADTPGWTAPIKAGLDTGPEDEPLLTSPQWALLWRTMLHALEPFPEARRAVIAAVERLNEPGTRPGDPGA